MPDSNPYVINYPQPTIKDQIVTASVGLGVSLAASVVLLGGIAAYSAVNNGLSKRKAKKAAKKLQK